MTLTLKRKYRALRIPTNPDHPKPDYNNTAGLGIATTLSYFLVIFYALFTSWNKTDNIGLSTNSQGRNSLTISQLMYNSEKVVTFSTTFLFAFLGIYMLYRKNFFELEARRVAVCVVFALIPIAFILITFYGPKCNIHYFIAAAVFIGGTVIQYLILDLYKTYFEDDKALDVYESMVDTMVVFAIIITGILIFSLVIKNSKKGLFPKELNWITSDTLAISEYIHLTIYGGLLYLFSTFNGLPSLKYL